MAQIARTDEYVVRCGHRGGPGENRQAKRATGVGVVYACVCARARVCRSHSAYGAHGDRVETAGGARRGPDTYETTTLARVAGTVRGGVARDDELPLPTTEPTPIGSFINRRKKKTKTSRYYSGDGTGRENRPRAGFVR